MTKICKNCKIEKQIKEYNKRQSICKECEKIQTKQWYQEHREEKAEYDKQYYEENKERKIEYQKQYHKEHREEILEKQKQYYERNKNKIRKVQNKYEKERRRVDLEYKLKCNISEMIRHNLKQNNLTKQGKRTFNILEYTLLDLRDHLESQFDSEMTWDNQGSYWHVDHIIPQSYYKFDSIEHPNFKKCWDLRNLRPLEAKENISKGNILDEKLIKQYKIGDLL